MTVFRLFLLRHRGLTAWLVAVALLMKMLVPTGYMVGTSVGSIMVELCSGYDPVKMIMHGGTHQPDKPDHQGKETPCAFSGLGAPSLGGADPLLLALAVAFIMALAFRIVPRRALPGAPAHLRPPKRGPPLLPSI